MSPAERCQGRSSGKKNKKQKKIERCDKTVTWQNFKAQNEVKGLQKKVQCQSDFCLLHCGRERYLTSSGMH